MNSNIKCFLKHNKDRKQQCSENKFQYKYLLANITRERKKEKKESPITKITKFNKCRSHKPVSTSLR